MAKASTGIKLLSALRKAGSHSAVAETPEEYFLDGNERAAFVFLKSYVTEYKGFPSTDVFAQETGLKTVVTNEAVEYYRDKARQRALYYALTPKVQRLTEAIKEFGADAAVDIAKEIVNDGMHLAQHGTGYRSIADSLKAVISDFNDMRWHTGLRGIDTGYDYLNRQTDGWQNADLVTIVGRPGTGKSYQMLHFAKAAWKSGRSSLFVSMEMNDTQMTRRLLGMQAGINPAFISKGRLSTYTYERMLGAAGDLSNGVPFNFVTGSFRQSVPAIRALCEEMQPDIIFVDASYLLLPGKKRQGSTGRRESVSDTIEELKTLAIDLNRPIVQSVQFNRQADRSMRKTVTHEADNDFQRRAAIGRDNSGYVNDGAIMHRISEDLIKNTAHLSLAKIGETDVIGQASSVVMGLEHYYPIPRLNDRRIVSLLKGREGEQGAFVTNYAFNPMDMSQCTPDQLISEYRATARSRMREGQQIASTLDTVLA